MPVILLVADGARPDALAGDLARWPALRGLRDDGALHEVTSVFPSVTGPAYAPFLLGRFPGPVGLPGLRWYDRARTTCGWPDHARSYVGYELQRIDGDLDPDVPTIFELVPHSLAALSVVTRGLAPRRRIGTLTLGSALYAALTHFRGDVERWLDLDRDVADEVVRRMHDERPDFFFAALTGVDKASHARGHDDPLVGDALAIVDDTVRRLRDDAERRGTWHDTHLWVASDHGHSAVHTHDDIASFVAAAGYRTVAHPFAVGVLPAVAVMVSGNAMAHLYLDLEPRARPGWRTLAPRWSALADALLARPSVDLLVLPDVDGSCEIRHAERGSATVTHAAGRFCYRPRTGDPLAIGRTVEGDLDVLWEATRHTDYPDAVVQIALLAASSRAGDLILSAAPGHDFRGRYEPIPHRSAHGALHREHMLVPLLVGRPTAGTPRRTTDVFASALAALGVAAPTRLDGRSFL